MSTLQEKFNKMLADQAELRAKFQEQAQLLFKDITKEFFSKNPGINAVIWTQYTPYFNDGDECVFQVHTPTFTNAPDPENVRWGEYDGDEDDVWAVDNIRYVLNNDRAYYAAERGLILSKGGVNVESCEAFTSVINSSEMEDIFRAMFGDHVQVVATREGFTITDYEHD
jgi:hypothetical protein